MIFQQGDYVIYKPPYSVANSAWKRRIGKVFIVLEDTGGRDVLIALEEWGGFYPDEVPLSHKWAIRRTALHFHAGSREPSWEL